MGTVYVVSLCYDYEGENVVAAFSTKERADIERTRLIKLMTLGEIWCDNVSLKEFQMDTLFEV